MRFRHRICEDGACELLKMNITLGQNTRLIAPKSLRGRDALLGSALYPIIVHLLTVCASLRSLWPADGRTFTSRSAPMPGAPKKTPQSGAKSVRRRTCKSQSSSARFYSSLWINGNISSVNL